MTPIIIFFQEMHVSEYLFLFRRTWQTLKSKVELNITCTSPGEHSNQIKRLSTVELSRNKDRRKINNWYVSLKLIKNRFLLFFQC